MALRRSSPWLLCALLGCSSSAPILGTGPGPLPGEGDPGDPDIGGQTGSPIGPAECLSEAECLQNVERELQGLTQPAPPPVRFGKAECVVLGVSLEDRSVTGSACECSVAGSSGGMSIGPVGIGCYALGRGGDCLWDDSQFAGCAVGDPEACTATCQALESKLAADAQRTFRTNVLYSHCSDSKCNSVVGVDDRCYANGSYRTGKAYDCSEGAEAILTKHLAPPPAPETLPNAMGTNMVPGTHGFINLSTYRMFSGTALVDESFSAYAQFFQNALGASGQYGDVIDPLEGVDDCGVSREGSTGFASDHRWTDVASLRLVDGAREYSFESTPASGTDFRAYMLNLTELDIAPRFGGTYDLVGGEGGFGAPISIKGLLLPAALSVRELEQTSRFERADLHLNWSGRGEAPLALRISVTPRLGDGGTFHTIDCMMADDGEFTIPASILNAVPDGFARAEFRRRTRSLQEQAGKTVAAFGSVTASYRFALGPPCDRSATMAACQRYAEHEAALYAQCGAGTQAMPMAEYCPDYLAEACMGCAEYFECQMTSTRCENGQLIHEAGRCACPE